MTENKEMENYFAMRDKFEQEEVLAKMRKVDKELGRLIKKCKRLNDEDREQILKNVEPLLLKTRLKILQLKGKPIIDINKQP